MFSEYSDCFVWRCDSCELEAEFARGEFARGGVGSLYDAVAELRARGWLIGRIAREWTHYCGNADCRKARGEKSAAVAARLLDQPFRTVK